MSAAFVSVSILVISMAMLVLWLRSASQSVLRRRFEQDYSAEVAEANQLEFLTIRRALSSVPEEVADYRGMLAALERDYQALSYLLRNAATVHVGRYSRAERLLIMDFRLLAFSVLLSRTLGWRGWRSSLLEMTTILQYFGNVVGQRLATFPSRLPS
ncbi:MAG: hypothetical protein ACRD35_07845 [Candidatus Acidiferrales bacterium]